VGFTAPSKVYVSTFILGGGDRLDLNIPVRLLQETRLVELQAQPEAIVAVFLLFSVGGDFSASATLVPCLVDMLSFDWFQTIAE